MSRYSTIPTTRFYGPEAYVNIRYPEIPLSVNDIYVYTTIGDRFDTLAYKFYGDQSLWWIISLANQITPQDSIAIEPGLQIRIPSAPQAIVQEYRGLNR